MAQIQITSFLVNLIDAINDVRECEDETWYQASHFQALQRCLDGAHELLLFELTRAPTQHENKLKVSPDVVQRRVTRQTTAKLLKRRIPLPDEVLNVIFSYFKDSNTNPTYLSSNAYNFSLVCKSWYRVANRRLWENVHLQDTKSTILFARSLYERHQSPIRANRSPLSIDDSIRRLHVHYNAEICCPASYTYVLDCVNLFTRNIVSLNLRGLSTSSRNMKLTEFYEITRFHPHLKHVWLCQVDLDSVEPLDPIPQLETCDCPIWWGPEGVETLELISAKTIRVAEINVFKKDAVKSVYCDNLSLFQRQAPEFKKLTHLYFRRVYDYGEQANALVEGFSRIVKLSNLSFLVLDISTHLADIYFDLIAEHCSLTTFVINWQPSKDSVDSWISCIQKMGPKLLSVGIGLEGEKHRDECMLQTIYQNCPNLRTLELYVKVFPSDPWPLQYASEFEELCHLPLIWIYAPWLQKWPQKWKSRCPKFATLCRLGLNVGLEDLPMGVDHVLDYNQPIRPAIVGDGFFG